MRTIIIVVLLHGIPRQYFFHDRRHRNEGWAALQGQEKKNATDRRSGGAFADGYATGKMYRRRSRMAVGKNKGEQQGLNAAQSRCSGPGGTFSSLGRAEKEWGYNASSNASDDGDGGSFCATALSSYAPLPSPSHSARPQAGVARRRNGADPQPTGSSDVPSAIGGGGWYAIAPGDCRTTLPLGDGRSGAINADGREARGEDGDVPNRRMSYEAPGGRSSKSNMETDPFDEKIWGPLSPRGGGFPASRGGAEITENRCTSKCQANGQQSPETSGAWGSRDIVSTVDVWSQTCDEEQIESCRRKREFLAFGNVLHC